MSSFVGLRFGRLVVLRQEGRYRGNSTWECRCDCSKKKTIRQDHLKGGLIVSCGCWRAEQSATRSRRHGDASGGKMSSEYGIWSNMIRRCTKPSCRSYRHYGGRGITVCDRWLNNFGAFLEDMGRRPSSAHSLERKDNNAGYSPDNCTWATLIEQANNKRSNVQVTICGRTQTAAQWKRELHLPMAGISASSIRAIADYCAAAAQRQGVVI